MLQARVLGGGLWKAVKLLPRSPLIPISQGFCSPSLPTRCSPLVLRAAKADDETEDEAPAPGKPLRVERLLANLGYGKRKECQQLVQRGRAVRKDGKKLKVGDKVLPSEILLDEEELDPASPVVLMLNKPVGYVVTSPDDERISDPKIYDLLPYRFGQRRPFLSAVGRLDKATSGLLLFTDDGQLVHRINSPKKGIWKVYEASLAAPLVGKDAETAAKRFASGALLLGGEMDPLLPARLEMLGESRARVSICEGRYHQVRRMFTAIGNEVVALHRVSVGGIGLGELSGSEWRYLSLADVDAVFSGPTTDQMMAASAADAATSAAGTRQGARQPVRSSQAAKSSGNVGDEDEGEDGSDEPEQDEMEAPDEQIKKIKDDERWKRRRIALKKML